MIKHPLYLVPFDFSPISDNAMHLALDLAKANDGGVFLFHVVKKSNEKAHIRQQFKDVLLRLEPEERELILTNVVAGDLYTDIGKAADILHASLIVMGTHGAVGLQKIFGSHAEKLISHSTTPILITQGHKPVTEIKTIVMPFNFLRESIQIVKFAGAIAEKFNAAVHLVGFHESDEWYEEKVKTNQSVARRLLDDHNVANMIVNLPKKASFQKEIMDYAEKVGADIIAAAYMKDGVLPTPNTFIQEIIENKSEIPVLTINAEDSGGQFYY